MEEPLVVYSDYVCPFCYLGKVSMERYLEDNDVDVEWRFYDLRGYKRRDDGTVDHGVDDGKDDAYFERVRENVERLCGNYGVEMELEHALEVDSWNAQKAALYVRKNTGMFDEFHDAVFEALWKDADDVGDPDVIARIADSVGLDGDEVRDALDDPELERELVRKFDEARAEGIDGIPTFVYGEHVARGAIPPEQFERLVG